MNRPGLNRQSSVPLYRQLANILEREIRSGARQPGTKLPSEKSLTRDFGVSRHVVRSALAEIAKSGLIDQHHGSGSYVSPQKIAKPIAALTSYRASMIAFGLEPDLRIIANEIVPASAEVAGQLGIEPGAPVIRLERLACINLEPASILEAVLPQTMFPDLLDFDFSEQSLYAALKERYGVHVTRSEAYIEAVTASEREATIMETKAGAVLLVLEGVSYDQHDRPVEYSRVAHRNDRFKFYIESFARDGPVAPPPRKPLNARAT
jgi:GntR family transcriptional regulator